MVIRMGQFCSDPKRPGNIGTSQGSVLSPLLSNVATNAFSVKLAAIPDVSHVIYAEDITIWANGGSLGYLALQRQQTLDASEDFLRPTDLKLSPRKSELAIFATEWHHKQRAGPYAIQLTVSSGDTMPYKDTVKILGVTINAKNGHSTEALTRLEKSTHKFSRCITPIANKRAGLLEDNVMKAYHAFLVGHVAYAAQFPVVGAGGDQQYRLFTLTSEVQLCCHSAHDGFERAPRHKAGTALATRMQSPRQYDEV